MFVLNKLKKLKDKIVSDSNHQSSSKLKLSSSSLSSSCSSEEKEQEQYIPLERPGKPNVLFAKPGFGINEITICWLNPSFIDCSEAKSYIINICDLQYNTIDTITLDVSKCRDFTYAKDIQDHYGENVYIYTWKIDSKQKWNGKNLYFYLQSINHQDVLSHPSNTIGPVIRPDTIPNVKIKSVLPFSSADRPDDDESSSSSSKNKMLRIIFEPVNWMGISSWIVNGTLECFIYEKDDNGDWFMDIPRDELETGSDSFIQIQGCKLNSTTGNSKILTELSNSFLLTI
jgi:hypothetical protein